MSFELISRSQDLKRLREDGYQIRIADGYLIVEHVPYVTSNRSVKYGKLVSALTLAGEKTVRPDTHVIFFAGEHPCNKNGTEIHQLKHSDVRATYGGVEVQRSFSNKPEDGYRDYHHKVDTYVNVISSPAQAIDPRATAKTFATPASEHPTVFQYADTATARAGIDAISSKLKGHKIGIVGLGGTGAYVLDLVAKTPVEQIHLFDGDWFHQHNAFRSPGAASKAALEAIPSKVAYYSEVYSRIHRGITTHEYFLDKDNAQELGALDFVFLCLDSGQARRDLIAELKHLGKSFIDVGMGTALVEEEASLLATVRVSTSTPEYRDAERHIPTCDSDPDPAYNTNIQIGDLNALNAALAVVRWKRLYGFYQDLEHEHQATYSTNVNQLLSEETLG